jgi:hypothetical protein
MLRFDKTNGLGGACDRLMVLWCLMAHKSRFGQRQAVGGTLCNLPMAVDSVRPRWYLVWRAALVVRVINLVDRLVMSILEDRELTLMRVETAETVVMRLFR